MRLKKTYHFLMRIFFSFMVEFYIVVIGAEILMSLLIILVDSKSSSSGMDVSSMILMFVVGMSCFKNPFRFLTGNGISRKTFLTATVLTGISAAGILLVIDTVNTLILKALPFFSREYVNVFETAFGTELIGINILKYIAFNLSGCLCTFVMGYFIASLNHRMTTKVKVAVYGGGPVLIAFVLPMLTSRFGTIGFNPFQTLGGSILTELIIMAVFGFAAWRLVSRASLSAN